MKQYIPEDITAFAREKAAGFPAPSGKLTACEKPDFNRRPGPCSQTMDRRKGGGERMKVKTFGRDSVQIDRETVDLRYTEQLVDSEQVAALGYLTGYARKHLMDGRHCLADIVRELERLMKEKGFEAVCESGWLPAGTGGAENPGNICLPEPVPEDEFIIFYFESVMAYFEQVFAGVRHKGY